MSIRLIINADDFGYFDGMSAGILEAAAAGSINATAIMANTEAFPRSAAALRSIPEIDAGVHLNATHGEPLTPQLRTLLRINGGTLPAKGALIAHLFVGRVPAAAIAAEWRAQIERCIAAGLTVRFLNSHEHIHMHPRLYPVIVQLAREFHIPFVRHTTADLDPHRGLRSALRNLAIDAIARLQSPAPLTPRLLGIGPSGRLDMNYIRRVLPRLNSMDSYELMCHPGREDAVAASNRRLRNYHDWTGELHCLLSQEFREALQAHDVHTLRFRDLA